MSKKNSLVSMVVPAYNHEDYVVDCIESILGQDYPNLDLIVINDGSTDSTGEIIEAYIKKHGEKFRYVSKKNEGLIKTLNLGIRMAKGKFFCELASDDMLLPRSIRARVEYLEANPKVDAVFADCHLLYGDNEKTTDRLIAGKKTGFTSAKHTIKDYLDKSTEIFFPTGMLKLSTLKQIGGFDADFRFCEDMITRYQLAMSANVAYLNIPVMYYRRHPTNVSGSPMRIIPEKILALEKLSRMVDDGNLKGLINKRLFKYNLKYFKLGMSKGLDAKEFSEALRKAVRIRPYSPKVFYYGMMNKFRKSL